MCCGLACCGWKTTTCRGTGTGMNTIWLVGAHLQIFAKVCRQLPKFRTPALRYESAVYLFAIGKNSLPRMESSGGMQAFSS